MAAATLENQQTERRVCSTRTKVVISIAVCVQLLVVLAEPFHFFSTSPARGPSHAARPLRSMLAAPVDFLYLNHGYFFFAPEPGPSHLMQCTLTMPEGKVVTLRYPDKAAQWPRLLYHRHFMLAEFLNQLHAPPVDPQAALQAPPEELQQWKQARQRFEVVRDSMQSHLRQRFQADSVTIERLRHILPGSVEVLDQELPLNDPRFYLVLPDSPPSEPLNPATQGASPWSPLFPLARPPRMGAGESIEAAP